MSSLGSILGTARMAINAHQAAIQVTSHNIANAETPGYTRQRVQLAANHPLGTPQGNVGTGVVVGDVTQLRDTLLDASVRRETSQAAGFGLRRDLLGQLEGVLNEPSEGAFAATLDAFWNSWSELASTPANPAAREVVRQRGTQVAAALQGASTRLAELAADTTARFEHAVGDVNALGRQVAELNAQIVAAETGGRTAGDLRDQRNLAVDALAKLVPVQVIERGDGSIAVNVANQGVVDGSLARPIAFAGTPPALRLTFAGSGDALPVVGGELGAMIELLDVDIPATRARLDDLAAGLVRAVNARHEAGWSPAREPVAPPAGPPPGWAGSGVKFFAEPPGGVTAASIALSSEVAASRDMIAVGSVYGGTGDNTVALGLSRLRDTAVPVGASSASVTLGTHFRDTVSDVALRAGAADSSATVFETLASQAEMRRQSVNGVSTDEELIQLMRHQQAYVAATRLVSTVDEMAQALLGMV